MGKGAMGLFGANMADFQMGLALDRGQQGGAARRRLNRLAAAAPWPPRGRRVASTPTHRFRAQGFSETDEEMAQDDDPLADIKAAWIMAGKGKRLHGHEVQQEITGGKQRDSEISSREYQRGKIDLLNRMRHTSTSWKDVKGNLQHAVNC